ncbi:MAG: DUF3592 domain-containing protein [Anaerolineae bacterium]|nr:DUF3592 domain-containing protein [Anaerolineae bacterium]
MSIDLLIYGMFGLAAVLIIVLVVLLTRRSGGEPEAPHVDVSPAVDDTPEISQAPTAIAAPGLVEKATPRKLSLPAVRFDPNARWVTPVIILVILGFLCGGVTSLGIGIFNLQSARGSTSWPTVEGTIKESEVFEYYTDTAMYQALVSYSYVVDNTRYTGMTVGYEVGGSSNPAPQREIVERYPVGSKVTVYYDPNDPQIAVLEPGAKGSIWGPVIRGTLLLFIGLIGGAVAAGRLRGVIG